MLAFSAMHTPTPEPLTPREAHVLARLCAGLSNRQLAEDLHVSEQTIKFHLKNIYAKLGVSGRTQAMIVARQRQHLGTADRRKLPEAVEELRRRMEPALSPLALMTRTRRLHGAREAVVDGDRRLSYDAFFALCDRVAAALAALDLQPGDRVALLAAGGLDALALYHAAPMQGLVLVPISTRLTAEEQVAQIRHCEARLVCAAAEALEGLDRLRPSLPPNLLLAALDGPRPGWIDHAERVRTALTAPLSVAVADDDLIAINYTSGTTGSPRGVMVSHRAVWMNAMRSQMHWPLSLDDRFLWLLPLSHANGWSFAWTVTAAGATHVCSREPALGACLDLLREERITALCLSRSNLVAAAHLADDIGGTGLPRDIRVLTAGAAPPIEALMRIDRALGWPLTHTYGLSETSVFVSFSTLTPALAASGDHAARARHLARQGLPALVGCDVRVVDEEGQDVPADGQTLGELVVRSTSLTRGYWRDPDASLRAFAGGWFHTGDAAVLHPDGAFEISDRIKDIIISDDQLVASSDVEAVIGRHPDVLEAAVVGVPDARLGEAIVAFVVPRNPSSFDAHALQNWLAGQLAAFKRPQRIITLAALPRTTTGKVGKQSLRDRAADPSHLPPPG